MKACVLTFAARSGTGTQTVTGVVDHTGAAFVGKVFLFQSAYAAINTLTTGAIPLNACADYRGVDTGSVRAARAATENTSTSFGGKLADSADSLGNHSILDGWTDNFGQFQFERTAKIAAIRAGEFDVLYDTNGRTGDTILVLVLGGDDLDVAFTNTINGTYSTPSKPQGILGLPLPRPAASGATSWGTGGHNIPWGFATRDGVYGTANLNVVNQGNNWSVQRTDAFSSSINQVSGALGALPTIAAWGDASFTIANGPANNTPMAICGATIRCAGGALTQPASPGPQTIPVGLHAKVILFVSIGQVAATTVSSPSGQLATGWATSLAQVGSWSGERRSGNTTPIYGARYLSGNTVLRFGSPEGSATVFHSVASVTAIDPAGTVTLTWSAVDGTTREILWFAIGDAPVPPTYETIPLVERRLRRAPHVAEENKRVFYRSFELDLERGVGLPSGQGEDPLVMLRISRDGGHTWGEAQTMSAGRIGVYTQRVMARRLGQARDTVFEVTVSDPVAWSLVGAWLDLEAGSN